MDYINNKEILSYYELSNLISESKCILNDNILDYFGSLLSLDISVLYKDGLDNITVKYLKELQLFRELVLYNVYHRSLKLLNNKNYILCNDKFNGLNISIPIQNFNFNIFSINYKNNIPNVCFYDSIGVNLSKLNDDYFMHNYENMCLLSSERNQLLQRFLSQNNLELKDFSDEKKMNGNKQKSIKYGFADVVIK